MVIAIALDQCAKIDEQIEKLENDEKRLKISYRIFNLDMISSKDLTYIKKVFIELVFLLKLNQLFFRILKYLNQFGY